jgi:hypothetical protein
MADDTSAAMLEQSCDPDSHTVVFGYVQDVSGGAYQGVGQYDYLTGAYNIAGLLPVFGGSGNGVYTVATPHGSPYIVCLSRGVYMVLRPATGVYYATYAPWKIATTPANGTHCYSSITCYGLGFAVGTTASGLVSTTVCPNAPGPNTNPCEFILPAEVTEASSAYDPQAKLTMICGQRGAYGPAPLAHIYMGGCFIFQTTVSLDRVGGNIRNFDGCFWISNGCYDPFVSPANTFNSDPSYWTEYFVANNGEGDFEVNGTATSSGNFTITTNGVACNVAVTSGNTAAQTASQLVSGYNASCTQSGLYQARVEGYTDSGGTASQEVYIEKTSGDPQVDSALAVTACCGQTVSLLRTFTIGRSQYTNQSSDLTAQMGVRFDAPRKRFVVLRQIDSGFVPCSPGSLDSNSPQALGFAGYAFPESGMNFSTHAITMTDWAGNNPVTITPGGQAPATMGSGAGNAQTYLIPEASSPQAGIISFENNFAIESTLPCINGTGLWPLKGSFDEFSIAPDGVYVIGFGCDTTGTGTGSQQICYAVYNPSTGTTTAHGFVTTANTGTVVNATGTVACGASGTCYMAIVVGRGSDWGLTGVGPAILTYKASPPYTSWSQYLAPIRFGVFGQSASVGTCNADWWGSPNGYIYCRGYGSAVSYASNTSGLFISVIPTP